MAIAQLKPLVTKRIELFTRAHHDVNVLKMIADFINAVAAAKARDMK